MRIPEQCPWCGADLEADDFEDLKRWECGAEIDVSRSVVMVRCGGIFCDTTDAVTYRRTLAARKRLSQHTGVPVRGIEEPQGSAGRHTWLLGAGVVVVVYANGDLRIWGIPHNWDADTRAGRASIATEARRRLMAAWEGRGGSESF